MRMPMKRRKEALPQAARHFGGGAHGDLVLFGVGARAEAVLEVDAEVFHGFGFELA